MFSLFDFAFGFRFSHFDVAFRLLTPPSPPNSYHALRGLMGIVYERVYFVPVDTIYQGGLPRKLFWKTLNGRLPLKHSPFKNLKLSKHVSDDPRHFIFQPPKTFFPDLFGQQKKLFAVFVKIMRSYTQMDVTCRFSMKNHMV